MKKLLGTIAAFGLLTIFSGSSEAAGNCKAGQFFTSVDGVQTCSSPLIRGIWPTDQPYNAPSNGTSDATAAISSACTAANAAGVPVVIAIKYALANTASVTCQFQFVPGTGQLNVATTKTLTIAGNLVAPPNSYIFAGAGSVVLSNAVWASASWWGAEAAAAAGTDAAPAMRAMLGSNRFHYIAPAAYTFKSHSAAIYPANQGGAVQVRSLSKAQFDRRGASFTLDNTQAATQTALWDWENNTDVQIRGGTMIGNRAGLISSQENSGDIFFSNNRLRLEDGVTYTGDWSALGTALAGNFNTDCYFDLQEIVGAGIGIDFGQTNATEIIVRKMSGSGTALVGVSVIWDPNFAVTTTLTAAPLAAATSLTVGSITGFANGHKVAVGRPETGYQYVTVNGSPSGSAIPITALPAAGVNGANVVDLQYNNTGVNFVEGVGNKLTILENAYVSGGFNQTVRLTTGEWIVDGNISNSGLGAGVGGYGLVVDYINGTSLSSVGHPVGPVIARGRYAKNGNVAHGGAGILVNANAVGHSTITGAVTNGAGGITLTVASTAALVSGQLVYVSGVGGVPEATGAWNIISIPSGTTFDIPVAIVGTYSTGGSYAVDAIGPVTFDGVTLDGNNTTGAEVNSYIGVKSYRVLGSFCPPSTVQTTCLGTHLAPVRGTNNPSNPTGVASAKMLGAVTSFVPNASGNVLLQLKGDVSNTNSGVTSTMALRYGSGTAPVNGDAVTGTVLDTTRASTAAAGQLSSFPLEYYLTGLVVGSTYWVDISLTPSANTSTAQNIRLNTRED